MHPMHPMHPPPPTPPPEASGFLVGLRRSSARASRSMRCWSSSLAFSPRLSGLMASSSCGDGGNIAGVGCRSVRLHEGSILQPHMLQCRPSRTSSLAAAALLALLALLPKGIFRPRNACTGAASCRRGRGLSQGQGGEQGMRTKGGTARCSKRWRQRQRRQAVGHNEDQLSRLAPGTEHSGGNPRALVAEQRCRGPSASGLRAA